MRWGDASGLQVDAEDAQGVGLGGHVGPEVFVVGALEGALACGDDGVAAEDGEVEHLVLMAVAHSVTMLGQGVEDVGPCHFHLMGPLLQADDVGL